MNRLLVFIAAWVLFVPLPTLAANSDEIETSAQFILGDNDSKLDGRRLALMEAKRNALEKAGTYIESFSEVQNFQLTKDQVRSYTAGILEVKETGEKWDMIGQSMAVTLTVKVRVDKGIVAKQLEALRKNSEIAERLEEARRTIQEHERKIAALNHELEGAKATQKESPQVEAALGARSKALNGVQIETLLARAQVALIGTGDEQAVYTIGSTSPEARSHALALLQEASALEPDHPKVLTRLGELMFEEGFEEKNLARAEVLFRRAINLDPSFADPYIDMAFILATRKDYIGAERASRKAISLKPAYGAAHYTLGFVLLRKGDVAQAVSEMREAVRLQPSVGAFRGTLGVALEKQGDADDALAQYRTGCELRDKTSCKLLESPFFRCAAKTLVKYSPPAGELEREVDVVLLALAGSPLLLFRRKRA